MGWQKTIIQDLIRSAHPEGGWGYRIGMSVHAEPTALACLALTAHNIQSDVIQRGLLVLKKLQKKNGLIPVAQTVDSPGWSTGLCLLAWLHAGKKERFRDPVEKAASWLLATYGKKVKQSSEHVGHNTTLQGWPWVEQTHSWAEPTSYAVLALRAAGYENHPRIQEATELLLDRAIPDGGWNYGNTLTLGQILQPFPCTTGIVLTALKGLPTNKRIEESVTYLTKELPQIRSPLSLGWGLMGLSAWNARPQHASSWLKEAAQKSSQREANALHASMLLLADAKENPLILDQSSILHDIA